MELRDRVQQRLDALGLSPRAASLKAGLNTHFLQAILSGKSESPRADNLGKLATALETNAEWLLNGSGDPNRILDIAVSEVIDLMPRMSVHKRRQLAAYARFLSAEADTGE